MAHIEYRKNKAGKITSARVIWYDNGDRHTEPFPDIDAAERWFNILELANNDTEKAENIVHRSLSKAPPFSEVAEKHINRLTDVQSGTRTKYRSQLKNYFKEFGPIPVAESMKI